MASAAWAACAGAPPAPAAPQGPTPEDHEVSQLLAVSRQGESRWRAEAGAQRQMRERLLAVSSAAGLALARKELHGLANRSLLQVLSQVDGPPGEGDFIRSHPVTLSVTGQPRALVNLLRGIEDRSPRFRVGPVEVARRRQGAAYETTIRVDVLERVAVPPPPIPPSEPPHTPPDHEQAVRALRAHILQLDQALTAAALLRRDLQTATQEVGPDAAPMSGALAALFPSGAATTLETATLRGGKLAARGRAATEEVARAWALAIEAHPAMAPGLVISLEFQPEGHDARAHVVDVDGEVRSKR